MNKCTSFKTLSYDHTDELHLVASDPYHLPYWLEPSLLVLDYLCEIFPSDESIMEIMNTNESFGRITIIDPCSSPTPVRLTMTLHPCFPLILSMHLKVLYCCKTQIQMETFATLLKQILLTYHPILVPSSMFMLGRTARQMNLKHTRHFSKNSMIFLPSVMKKSWG